MTSTQLAPALNRKSLENTYRYAGGTVSILLSGDDTGGTFSLWEAMQKPGSEPPFHVHHSSDETFYVLEGKIRFLVGNQVIEAGPGDAVFAQRGIPHTFRIKSSLARTITMCTPGGFEEWFRKLGEPASSFQLPEEVLPFSEADFPKMLALAKQLQTEIIVHKADI